MAKLWLNQSHDVSVVTRSTERAKSLSQEGYSPLVADVTNPETLQELPKVDTVLFAVGFDRNSGNSIAEVYSEGVKNVLAALPSTDQKFIYISTTGVYGSAEGDWVDESTPPNPHRDGGKASLAAELQLGSNATILRLAGIYGPERIPYLDKLRRGDPITAPSEGWLNLIHVDDAAEIVVQVEKWAESIHEGPHTFCVSDGVPVIRGEYYREVAKLIDAPEPKFAAPDPNSPAAARASANKRISNAKLTRTLNYQYRYPSYREGLQEILS